MVCWMYIASLGKMFTEHWDSTFKLFALDSLTSRLCFSCLNAKQSGISIVELFLKKKKNAICIKSEIFTTEFLSKSLSQYMN